MVLRSARGRPLNAPAAFIHPCQPTVAKQPPSGPGWQHDGYRLQIHVRDGRVRLYTMNGNDWTKRYPRIVEEAARLREPLIIDAEVVCLDGHSKWSKPLASLGETNGFVGRRRGFARRSSQDRLRDIAVTIFDGLYGLMFFSRGRQGVQLI